MADLESRVDNIDARVSNLEIQVTQLSTKIDMFVTETREQNKMRADEIRELRQDMNAMQANTDAKINALRQDMNAMRYDTNTSVTSDSTHNLVTIAIV